MKYVPTINITSKHFIALDRDSATPETTALWFSATLLYFGTPTHKLYLASFSMPLPSTDSQRDIHVLNLERCVMPPHQLYSRFALKPQPLGGKPLTLYASIALW